MNISETKRYGLLLQDEKPEVRLDTLKLLAHLGPGASDLLPRLWHIALYDTSSDVQSKACQVIWSVESDKHALVGQIIDMLEGDEFTKTIAALQFLAVAEISTKDSGPITDRVWKLLHNEYGDELDAKCICTLMKAYPEQGFVLEKLLSDRLIDTKRKLSLVTSVLFRTKFHRDVENEPDRFLPWIVDLLRSGSQNERTELIDWMVDFYPNLPTRWTLALKDELWQFMNLFGDGFQSYCKLEGMDKAMSRLLNDPAIPQENVGAILLCDAPPSLLRTRLEDNAYQTISCILEAMVHPDWTVRESAVRWIENHGADLSSDLYEQCIDSLEQRIREDSHFEVQVCSENAVASLIQRRRSSKLLRQGKLAHMIGDQELDVDTRAKALKSLAKMESREAMSAIVRQWLVWISATNRSLLVDLAENLLRKSKYSVLPLLNRLDISSDQSDDTVNIGDAKSSREGTSRGHIYRLLCEMSDERFFDGNTPKDGSLSQELRLHAVPSLAALLEEENDTDSRENIARLLANVGGQLAVSAISKALAGEDRERRFRQELLSTYYLAPSKRQSEQAELMLEDAVAESKRTMRVLQGANILVFLLGIAVIGVGLAAALHGDEVASRVIGMLAASGSLGSLLFQLTHNPLGRLQRSVSKMVQIETVFTSFVWELNLCSTYIQSQYIASGVLSDKAVNKTVERIERAAEQAVRLMIYADEDG